MISVVSIHWSLSTSSWQSSRGSFRRRLTQSRTSILSKNVSGLTNQANITKNTVFLQLTVLAAATDFQPQQNDLVLSPSAQVCHLTQADEPALYPLPVDSSIVCSQLFQFLCPFFHCIGWYCGCECGVAFQCCLNHILCLPKLVTQN